MRFVLHSLRFRTTKLGLLRPLHPGKLTEVSRAPKLDTLGTANQTSSFGNPRAKYSRLHITGYGIRRPVSSSFAAVNTQSFRRKLSSGAGSRLQPRDRDFLVRREKEETNYAKASMITEHVDFRGDV